MFQVSEKEVTITTLAVLMLVSVFLSIPYAIANNSTPLVLTTTKTVTHTITHTSTVALTTKRITTTSVKTSVKTLLDPVNVTVTSTSTTTSTSISTMTCSSGYCLQEGSCIQSNSFPLYGVLNETFTKCFSGSPVWMNVTNINSSSPLFVGFDVRSNIAINITYSYTGLNGNLTVPYKQFGYDQYHLYMEIPGNSSLTLQFNSIYQYPNECTVMVRTNTTMPAWY